MSLNDLKHLENRIQESGKIILKLNQQLRQEKETKRSLHVLLQDTRNNYRLTKGWLPTDLQKIRDGHIVYGTKKDIDNIPGTLKRKTYVAIIRLSSCAKYCSIDELNEDTLKKRIDMAIFNKMSDHVNFPTQLLHVGDYNFDISLLRRSMTLDYYISKYTFEFDTLSR